MRETTLRLRKLTLATTAVVALAVPLAGGIAPAVAQSANAISQSDRAEGARADPQLVAEFGGRMRGPQADYVDGVGKTIAMQSGLGNAREDFIVTLLNSPINNAFAIPGGFIYVTRDLVALMNNEAELAAVLGHEVGHVAARHSAKRKKASTRNSILGVLGQVLGSVVGGGFGGLLSQGAQYGSQLLTLSYSRGQETEADNLGIRYLRGAGYDPRALSSMLASLAAQTALDARLTERNDAGQVPEWASTHPDPASRVRTTLRLAGATGGAINRDQFLARIDGIMYGDDPAQGVVEGNSFVHPRERFAFRAPPGFSLVNGTRAVSISGQSGQGQFSTAPYNGSLDRYLAAVFAGLSEDGQIPVQEVERTTINGMRAAYGTSRVNTGSGQVDVVVVAYELAADQAYHFVTLSAPGRAGVFQPMFASMRRLSPGEAANVRPRRIDVHTVRAGDTIQSLARRMAYPNFPVERFLVLNGLTAGSRLMPGQKVKLVVY